MANGGPKENIKRSEKCRRARLAFVSQPAPHSEATGKRLCEDYETRDDLLKALPDLILRHNLYGIDIDSRACQIAALALWLLAQRAYLALGLKPIERPPITKTNIVCAEPMPGEIDMLREFTAGLTPKVLGQFFDYLTDDEFWTRAENDIAEALELYARQAENGQPFQRRLFADDTIQGFAFVDICQKRYDVVLMNPPFGDASIPSKDYIEEVYGDTKGNVYKTFIECFQDRLVPCGMLGMISSSAGFFLAQSTDWRERIVLRLYRPHLMADLGYGVLDAMVETAAYVLRSISEEENRQLTLSILSELRTVPTDREGAFSIPTYQQHRRGLKRH